MHWITQLELFVRMVVANIPQELRSQQRCTKPFVITLHLSLLLTLITANSSKKYLEGKLSLATMYDLYVEKYRQTDSDPVRVSYYRHIFDNEFNLAFHNPKKDFCNFCHKHNSSTIEEKIEIENEHAAHQS